MPIVLIVLAVLSQAADREMVERTAAAVTRRYTDLTRAKVADWDAQYQCTPPPPLGCTLRDGLPIFLLTEPVIIGDSARVTIQTLRPGAGGRVPTNALDVELILRKRDGKWLVVGTGRHRAS